MTEPREHWTDDLIEAVRDGMSVETLAANDGEAIVRFTYIPCDDDVNNVIAAVEEWVDYPAVSCPKCHGCARCSRSGEIR